MQQDRRQRLIAALRVCAHQHALLGPLLGDHHDGAVVAGRRRGAAQPDIDDPDRAMRFAHHTPAVATLARCKRASLAGRPAVLGVTLDRSRRHRERRPGVGVSSARAVIATRIDHSGAAPLYDVLAGLRARTRGRARLPPLAAGRAARCAHRGGRDRAARVLVPKDPLAGLAGVVVLVLAPPFRESSPALLAACGTVWALALTGELAALLRMRDRRRQRAVSRCRAHSPRRLRTPRDQLPLGLGVIGSDRRALARRHRLAAGLSSEPHRRARADHRRRESSSARACSASASARSPACRARARSRS